MNVADRIAEFHTRQGEDCLQIKGDGFWVYSNGARRDSNPYGPLIEPPDDTHERDKIRQRFYEEKLRRAVNEFTQMKQSLLSAARANVGGRFSNPAPDTDHAVHQLNELRNRVHECQTEFEKVRKQAVESTPARTTERDRTNEVYKFANQEFFNVIDQIQI